MLELPFMFEDGSKCNRCSPSLTYSESGVSIDAQDEAISRLSNHARATFGPRVLTDIGMFGAAFNIAFKDMVEPVLVSSTDGVGTKLKYTARFGTYKNAGTDLVSTCINDIICVGATPLFFLDYIGINKVVPEVIEELVEGMADACKLAECSLIGGEIAEMKDIYSVGEFDLVGFGVGVVDRAKMLPSCDIMSGDMIIGLPSSGIHCNGFSLVRRVFQDMPEEQWKNSDALLGCTLIEEVTRPARIYWKEAKTLLEKCNVKALIHISGGGLSDNIPRVLPKGLGAEIWKKELGISAIFNRIAELGPVEEREMFRTFNMGTGLAIIVSNSFLDDTLATLSDVVDSARVIGTLVDGSGVSYI